MLMVGHPTLKHRDRPRVIAVANAKEPKVQGVVLVRGVPRKGCPQVLLRLTRLVEGLPDFAAEVVPGEFLLLEPWSGTIQGCHGFIRSLQGKLGQPQIVMALKDIRMIVGAPAQDLAGLWIKLPLHQLSPGTQENVRAKLATLHDPGKDLLDLLRTASAKSLAETDDQRGVTASGASGLRAAGHRVAFGCLTCFDTGRQSWFNYYQPESLNQHKRKACAQQAPPTLRTCILHLRIMRLCETLRNHATGFQPAHHSQVRF